MVIPIAFFMLGIRADSVRLADALVRISAAIVLGVGLAELLFPDQFTKVLDIAKFYVNRGAMVSDQAQLSSNLFISGMRPEQLGGRNLLPFLGAHRVSSIFLEPVTAGNYGVLVVVWGLVRSLTERKLFWGMGAAGAAIVVLADSRFGAVFCVAALILALMPSFLTTAVAIVLPAVALAGIFVAESEMAMSHAAGNGFASRLLLSASFLDRLSIANLFGVQSPSFTAYDSGYAYLFCGVGIVGALGFWLALWSLPSGSASFTMFRNQIAAYYAALLCVSNSAFTIKFASLLWFLAGVLYVRQDGPKAKTPGSRPGL
jgi:putative polymerase